MRASCESAGRTPPFCCAVNDRCLPANAVTHSALKYQRPAGDFSSLLLILHLIAPPSSLPVCFLCRREGRRQFGPNPGYRISGISGEKNPFLALKGQTLVLVKIDLWLSELSGLLCTGRFCGGSLTSHCFALTTPPREPCSCSPRSQWQIN